MKIEEGRASVCIPSPGKLVTLYRPQSLLSAWSIEMIVCLTILAIRSPGAVHETQSSAAASDTRIRCINIPPAKPPASSSKSREKLAADYIESHKTNVEHAIRTEILSDDSVKLAGIVVDFFCTPMIDVAHQFNVPSYLFFTSGAAFLGFMLYLPICHDQVGAEFDRSGDESIVPSYEKPVPGNVLPDLAFDKDGYTSFVYHGLKFKETKGFIVNTFYELETHAVNSMMVTLPPIYPVGPLLDLKVKENLKGPGSKLDEILAWLDDQPPSSVVFLCFGSRGCFQVLL